MQIIYHKVDAEMMSKVFWTGQTKSGCAGQYSDCFSDGSDDFFEGTILRSEIGGSCVGFAMSGDEFIAKTMPCDRKIFLGCQSFGERKVTALQLVVIRYFFLANHSRFNCKKLN
jgi:hypothetical protein